MEILAPSGSKESLIGAINAGAQAIYLAGKRFGARAYASNFDDDHLIEVIRYAHLRGVFVYVAVNTVIFDDEVKDLLDYTDFLVHHDVDAFIVQDIGMIEILTRRYPNIEIHASTQVNTHNISQVRFLKEIGVKRIVLARETSIETIKQIKKNVDIEIEVFVHGALCVCFSGNCLMSSMHGGRSGNRGECAQPCRLPYTLIKDTQIVSEQSYLLSTKDLMTLDHMDELIAAGVDSFKIEGRMRKPEYVIQSVLSYKKAIDSYKARVKLKFEDEIYKLKKVFNREYTKGYLFDEVPNEINNDFRPNHLGVPVGTVIDYKDNKAYIKLTDTLEINDGYRIVGDVDYGNSVSRIIKGTELVKKAFPNEVIKLDVTEKIVKGSQVLKTLDTDLERTLSIFLDENYKTIGLTGHVYAYVGSNLVLEVSDGKNNTKVESLNVLDIASKSAVGKQQIMDQISKLGNTPFYFESLDVETDNKSFIPIKLMNDLRREALDRITEMRTEPKKKLVIDSALDRDSNFRDQPFELIVKVSSQEQLDEAVINDIHTIYYEDLLKPDYIEGITLIPVKKRIQMHHSSMITGLSVVNEIGSLYDNHHQYPMITNEFLNVTNIYSANLISRYGAKRVTLSPELSKDKLFEFSSNYEKAFHQKPNLELVVYGRVDVMISKYCPIAKTFKTKQNCHLCERNQYYLQDRVGNKFPLINDGNCNIRILNNKPLNLSEFVVQLRNAGIQTLRIDFTTERKHEVTQLIKTFKKALDGDKIILNSKEFTFGRFLK